MDFTAPSADQGLCFAISAQGQWRDAGRHHDPGAVAALHIIDEVTPLAAASPLLAPVILQHRVNALLGHPRRLAGTGIRLNWTTVHVHVDPEDTRTAHTRTRLEARRRAEWEAKQLRMAQAVAYRDQLREDPTLVLAQMLLDAPQTVTDQTISLIPRIAEQVAAHAPGATWVQTARLLDAWFRDMAPDAKRFIIDRLCTVAAEFGGEYLAEQVEKAHRSDIPDSPAATAE
ncbi:hypothetical protein ABZ725_50335 [Streptomyces sp. NPDC006872]|uniref:hypothetical protein n=1 Tax=Streptomyces sp. NPDC006872 TaxID=3155720 RepID=UPI0033EDAD0D